jgi:hypothetical protein
MFRFHITSTNPYAWNAASQSQPVQLRVNARLSNPPGGKVLDPRAQTKTCARAEAVSACTASQNQCTGCESAANSVPSCSTHFTRAKDGTPDDLVEQSLHWRDAGLCLKALLQDPQISFRFNLRSDEAFCNLEFTRNNWFQLNIHKDRTRTLPDLIRIL